MGALPLYAAVAIERLQADESLRTAALLDTLIDAYAGTYGMQCDPVTRDRVHAVALSKFALRGAESLGN